LLAFGKVGQRSLFMPICTDRKPHLLNEEHVQRPKDNHGEHELGDWQQPSKS